MPSQFKSRSSHSSASTAKSHDSHILDEGNPSSLRSRICAVFTDAQNSNTGHKKLAVALRKVQEACCYEAIQVRNNTAEDDFEEDDFNREFLRCLFRALPIKKTEPVGDRMIKFTGLFLKHATDLDSAIFQGQESDAALTMPETPTSRLTSHIISTILPLLNAKDKVVRFRSTQTIACLINTLDSVDDDLFAHIRLALLKRLRDRETNVRVQAVYGLARLAGEAAADDDDDSDDETTGGVLEKLLDALQNDPSAEVRRNLLLNLPFTPSTLPFLLERARDLDPSIRRSLYARLLPALGDFRHLSLTHREKLLRWGLRDRDENVRKATAKLFRERWIEDCARPRDSEGEAEATKPGQLADPSSEALLELLERIDVVNAGNDGGIALDAMKDFWDGRPDYRDFITFNESFWNDLSAESIFVARTFNDFCRQDGASDVLQEKMPEVTRLAFLLQSNVNVLVESIQRIAVQEDSEEDCVQQEFIVEQLLQIALTLDYSDEVGRRTTFSLMREALAIADLPEESTRLVVEVLRITCGTNTTAEREFCGVVLEAIAEVHDTIMGDDMLDGADVDESFHSARSEMSGDTTPKSQHDSEHDEEKAIREIMVNMKCLHIAQCMLQNVNCNLENNEHLITMLNSLVVPAVRSQEAPIRERGLLCLGLCCLLDKNLADENLTLFLHCFNKGHEQLQQIVIQIIGDILTAHPAILATPNISPNQAEDMMEREHALAKPIHKLFSKSLRSPSLLVQSTACTALCKLMLSAPPSHSSNASSILTNEDLLRSLVVAYFDPETAQNPALRQSLSYFLPVYCHSRKENMQRMGRITVSVLNWFLTLKEELDIDGEDENTTDLVSSTVVVAHLADWTDGRKLAMARKGTGSDEDAEKDADGDVQLDLACDALNKVLGVCSKTEGKVYISLLGKIFITVNSNLEKLNEVSALIKEAIDDKSANDAATRNTLSKLDTALGNAIQTQGGIGAIVAKSRNQSIAPSITDDDDDDEVTVLGASSDQPINSPQRRDSMLDSDLPSSPSTPNASSRKKSTKQQSLLPTSQVDIEESFAESTVILATPPSSPQKIMLDAVPTVETKTRSSPRKKVDRTDQRNASSESTIDLARESITGHVLGLSSGNASRSQVEIVAQAMVRKSTAPRKSVRAGRRREAESEGESMI